jgi:hypothetical protein
MTLSHLGKTQFWVSWDNWYKTSMACLFFPRLDFFELQTHDEKVFFESDTIDPLVHLFSVKVHAFERIGSSTMCIQQFYEYMLV